MKSPECDNQGILKKVKYEEVSLSHIRPTQTVCFLNHFTKIAKIRAFPVSLLLEVHHKKPLPLRSSRTVGAFSFNRDFHHKFTSPFHCKMNPPDSYAAELY
jgi:hypothetical protein